MYKIIAFCLVFVAFTFATEAQTKESRQVDSFTKVDFRVAGKLYLRQGSTQKVEIEGDKEYIAKLEIKVEGNRLIIGRENWKNWGWSWNDDEKITAYVTIPTLDGVSVSGSGDLLGEGKFKVGDLDLNVSGSGSLDIEADASGMVDADVSGSGEIRLLGNCRRFDSHVSGSGRVRMSETIAENASFGVSGSGKIEASGTAKDVKASISGSGKVLAANLEVESCNIRISGSGDVEINVKSELDAHISGSGSVNYKGNPSHVNSHASGSGHVRKM